MPFTYPDVLTNAAWQKKKGLFARATKETGIGASLTALEKAFRASSIAKVNPQVLAAEMMDPLLYTRRRANLRNALREMQVPSGRRSKRARILSLRQPRPLPRMPTSSATSHN